MAWCRSPGKPEADVKGNELTLKICKATHELLLKTPQPPPPPPPSSPSPGGGGGDAAAETATAAAPPLVAAALGADGAAAFQRLCAAAYCAQLTVTTATQDAASDTCYCFCTPARWVGGGRHRDTIVTVRSR